MSYYVPLPAARVPKNAMLDFSGITKALDKHQDVQRENAMETYRRGREAKSDARAEERYGWQRQEFEQGQKDRHAKVLGGMAQSLLDASPEQRPAMLQAWRQQDADLEKDLAKNGYRVEDIDTWAPAVIGRARGYQEPLERRKAEADIRYTESRADFYGSGGRGTREGALQSRIDRLMDEDQNLTYREALALAQRAPRDESLGRERLAQSGARSAVDPEELDAWRDRYGVGPNSQPPRRPLPSAGGPSSALPRDFGGGYRRSTAPRGSRDNPITPRTQSEIDNAPAGSVFVIDGQLMVK